MARRYSAGLNYRPTAADDWEQPRLDGMPAAELGGRRLIPAMERPYTAANAPLFAGLSEGATYAEMFEAGDQLDQHGECAGLIEE